MSIWKNKWKILEGIWYNHVVFFFNKKHWAINLVKHRRAICQECPHFDKHGFSELVVLKGLPACGLCGCNINEKTACLSCHCSLKDEGKAPKWEATTEKQARVENQIQKYL